MKKRKKMIDAGKQAKWFDRVRQAHQSETAEDYVEMIADLIEANREARVTDLAKRFGVSHPTVNKVIGRLKKEGLVSAERYRSLYLTDKGREMAEYCKARHIVVVDFLKALGVSEAIAEMDAEGVEHHVSAETLEAFENFTRQAALKAAKK